MTRDRRDRPARTAATNAASDSTTSKVIGAKSCNGKRAAISESDNSTVEQPPPPPVKTKHCSARYVAVTSASAASASVTIAPAQLKSERNNVTVTVRPFEAGLAKTRRSFLTRLRDLALQPRLDEAYWEEFEAVLIGTDMSVRSEEHTSEIQSR